MYIVIVGSGRVGAHLANKLAAEEHDVVVVDRDPAAFNALGSVFNGITVVGHGIDEDVLRRAGIEQADAFAAVTSDDNVNLMAAQVAKEIFQVPRVTARVFEPRRQEEYREFGIETVCATELGAEQLHLLLGVDTIHRRTSFGGGEVQLVDLPVLPEWAEQTVGDLELPGKIRVAAVQRHGSVLIPEPDTVLEKDDVLIASVRLDALSRLRERFRAEEE